MLGELRKACEALEESEERYYAAVDGAFHGFIIYQEGVIKSVNQTCADIYGHSVDEMIHKSITYFLHPDFHTAVNLQLEEAFAVPYEFVGVKKDGSPITLDLCVKQAVYQGRPARVAAIRDVTKRKALEEARNRLAAIVESSDDAIIGLTLDGTVVSWNPGAERIYGYLSDEMKGRSLSVVVPPDRHDVTELLERIRQGERVEHYQTERIKKNGRRIHVAITVSPIKDSSGAITGASTIDRNITQQKRVADERDRFFTLSLDMLCIINFDGFIRLVSHAWTKSLGYSTRELMTHSFIDFVHPDDRDATSAEFQKLRIGAASKSFENRLRHKDGSYRWFLWNGIAYFAEEVIYATARDITSMKLEEQERDKMVRELQDAVTNIKTLTGLLPICATCRKVRDDQGYWEQLEAYIEKHSNAEFTHGLCPSCAHDRYPEMFPSKHATAESSLAGANLKPRRREGRETSKIIWPPKNDE